MFKVMVINRRMGDVEWYLLFDNLTRDMARLVILRQGISTYRNGWRYKIVRE